MFLKYLDSRLRGNDEMGTNQSFLKLVGRASALQY